MSKITDNSKSRRDFLKDGGRIVAASALTAGITPSLYAAGSGTIKLALIGCGGRGTGAAGNALNVKTGKTKLVAMADVFQSRLDRSYQNRSRVGSDKVDVPKSRQFLGFEAYKDAMSCLDKGDVVILGTPPAFRWVHFKEAIKRGLNVFMEKPVTVDGPTTKRMIELAKQATKKNLKCGVGLMVRHCRGRQELKDRIENGEIGEILMMRGYRMGGRASACKRKPDNISDVLYQIQKFHSFLWASGGMYNDYYIHQIDELSWMKGAWPIEAHALGGRHYRDDYVDQNLDTYDVEYTYPDGARLFYQGRNISGCKGGFSSYVHGTKGSGIVSKSGHTPGRVATFKGHNLDSANVIWRYPQPEKSPYQLEWDDLIEAIVKDKPYNEVERGAIASMVSSMGRMAAHTGQVITYDQMLNCPHEFAPNADKLTNDGPAPVPANPDGTYPVPKPGILKDREY